jgi:hypothetical protein
MKQRTGEHLFNRFMCVYIYKYISFALIPHFFIFLAVQLPFNVLYTLPLYISFSDCVRPERERERERDFWVVCKAWLPSCYWSWCLCWI